MISKSTLTRLIRQFQQLTGNSNDPEILAHYIIHEYFKLLKDAPTAKKVMATLAVLDSHLTPNRQISTEMLQGKTWTCLWDGHIRELSTYGLSESNSYADSLVQLAEKIVRLNA